MSTVFRGSIYEHKNGQRYVVEEVPINVNTEEFFVVYRRVGAAVGEQKYVRPKSEFESKFVLREVGRDTSAPRSFA